MSDPGLLSRLVEHATTIGYEVLIDDASSGEAGFPPDLVFLQASDGTTYSLSVERIG